VGEEGLGFDDACNADRGEAEDAQDTCELIRIIKLTRGIDELAGEDTDESNLFGEVDGGGIFGTGKVTLVDAACPNVGACGPWRWDGGSEFEPPV
jgi:hypothetical protein